MLRFGKLLVYFGIIYYTCSPVFFRLGSFKQTPITIIKQKHGQWQSSNSQQLDILFESLTRLGTIWIIDCCSCEPRKLDTRKYMAGWWFGTFYINFHILGMSSSHWTNSIIFQRGRAKNHQPVSVSHTLSCKSCRSITWFSSVPRLCSSLEDLGRPEKTAFLSEFPSGMETD